jgi:hypothetical protein
MLSASFADGSGSVSYAYDGLERTASSTVVMGAGVPFPALRHPRKTLFSGSTPRCT